MKASDPRVAEGLVNDTGGKMVLLVADGLGGLPHPKTLRTELETARTPHLDALAKESVCGLHTPIAPGITPGSGPAHMGLFGYDPVQYEIGRGVLEALGIDFDLKPGDVAIRVNFATVDDDGLVTDRRAGRIPTEKCEELTGRLDGIRVPGVEIMVRPVKEHRAVVVLRGEGLVGGLEDTDPQETGVAPRCVKALTKEQEHTAEVLKAFVSAASEMLKNEPRANMILLRGIASRDPIPTLQERFGIRAGAIAGYPMYRGVAGLVGMEVLPPAESAEELVAAARSAYDMYDYLFLHFKKTDSTGEDGDFDRKVEASETLDTLIPGLLELDPDVLVVTGDHSTPSALASHSWHPVPLLLRARSARIDAVEEFGESACLRGGLGIIRAVDVMPLMLAHAGRLEKFGA
jgi:2,3-bisphosphoglycerate-independent phosphoglycerate mutase